MAIVFQGLQDPWGLSAIGSTLGEGFMKAGLMQGQEKLKIAEEQRKAARDQAEKIQKGGALSTALKIATDTTQTPQARLGALQEYISLTGDNSILPMIKDIGREGSRESLLQSLGINLNRNNQQPTAQQPTTNQNISTQQPEINAIQPQKEIAPTNVEPTQPKQRTIKDLTDDELIAVGASGDSTLKTIVDNEFKRRDLEQKQFNEDRKYHERGIKTAVEHVRNLRMSLPKKQFALSLARDAVASGETGAFSWNNLAEITGRKEFLTAKGAQLVAAAKENLFSNMSKVSAKAQNQWLEQRMASQFPEIGKSNEANLTMQAILEGEVEMDKAYVDAFTRLEKQDMDKYGYKRSDIDARAEEEVAPIYEKIMRKTSFLTREEYEKEKGAQWVESNIMKKVPKGTMMTPLTWKTIKMKYPNDSEKTIETLKKLGYTIPSQQELESWL